MTVRESEEEAEGGGRDSTGLMQATEGAMKSLRASEERMADMVEGSLGLWGGKGESCRGKIAPP